MASLESVKNHTTPTRLPPSSKEPLVVSEASIGRPIMNTRMVSMNGTMDSWRKNPCRIF